MKNIRFISVKFLNYEKKVARKINLDNDVVIIQGGNQSGKSCITKSLYSTMGADLKRYPLWQYENVISLLDFKIDNALFQYLHIGTFYYVFTQGKIVFKAKTKEENAKKLSDLLQFNLSVGVGQSEVVLSNSYMFLPFYIDQDEGWQQPLNSFSKIGSSMEKMNALYYHTGIINDDYFFFRNSLLRAKKEFIKVKADLESEERFTKYVEEKFKHIRIALDDKDCREEIDDFVNHVNSLKKKLEGKIEELKKLYNKKGYVEFRIKQLHDSITEIDRDLKFAVRQPSVLTCPMCGSKVDNDAVGAYEIIRDEDDCKQMLIEFQKELATVDERIKIVEEDNSNIRENIANIEKIITVRKGNVTIKEVLESQMHKLLLQELTEHEQKGKLRKCELEGEIEQYSQKIKTLEGNLRKDEIEKDFYSLVLNGLKLMKEGLGNINNLNIGFGTKIRTSGSMVTKCVLAYTYAYCNLIAKYNGPLSCPIVIDEPNQNGCDEKSMKAVLDYILESKPANSQLILSVNEDEVIGGDDKLVIDLADELEILCKSEFRVVKEEIESLLASDVLYLE